MLTRDGEVVWILDEAVLEHDDDGIPVWHGVLYDITERKIAEAGAPAARRPAGGRRAARRAGAAGTATPTQLMQWRVSLIAEIEGVEHACIWELGRDGRRPRPARRARGRGGRRPAGRVSAARDSHAGAALESGLHVIVDDWRDESRFAMPRALRALGIRSSLAV